MQRPTVDSIASSYGHLQVPFYVAAQISGAMVASFVLRELLHPITDLGTTAPSDTAVKALVMEIVVTFCMMFVTSAVATDTKAVSLLSCFHFSSNTSCLLFF